jgi:hypothetical protein
MVAPDQEIPKDDAEGTNYPSGASKKLLSSNT